ncbi:16S rRNA (cytosine(1402)-N(4))-methyltransferase RsmH [soil metagenome]
MNNYHTSVLLQEVLTYLTPQKGELYIDCTLGGGGHSLEIIKRGGRVLGFDVDSDAIAFVREKLKANGFEEGKDLTIVQENFNRLESIAKEKMFDQVSGILMDLGVSSYQFDTPERGFSFQNGPLDMRMGQELSVKARDLVNGLTERELSELFERFGEEPFAKKIAKAIVEKRKIQLFETTEELAMLVKQCIRGDQGVHPATRIFQALRIAVNDELNALHETLPQALNVLRPGGRLAVISFHSLEDRIVKRAFEGFEKEGLVKILTGKPIIATDEEVLLNRRARSAKLRVIEKI